MRTNRPLIKSTALAAALFLMLSGGAIRDAFAQQSGQPNATIISPQGQQGGSSVLELPKMPASQGGDLPSNLRPLVPQPGQELEIPPRQLRGQAGYAQVTLTVTDSSGRYVTGLNRDDIKLFVDGTQRPDRVFPPRPEGSGLGGNHSGHLGQHAA